MCEFELFKYEVMRRHELDLMRDRHTNIIMVYALH